MSSSSNLSVNQFRYFIDLLTPDGPLAVLDESLGPCEPEILFEFARKAGFGGRARVLDAGCADGARTVRLAEEFGCEVQGVDHDNELLVAACQRAGAANVADRVHFRHASLERLPFEDGQFDAVWCREVVYHVRDLPAALGELHRVTRPRAPLVIQTCIETDEIDPRDAERIYQPLTLVGPTMREPNLLAMLRDAGWEVRERTLLGSEIKEYREETEGQVSRAIMRLSRLLRQWDRFTEEFGEDLCRTARAFYELTIYPLLGKLSLAFYIAERC